METSQENSPINVYCEYLQQNYPALNLNSYPQLLTDVEKTNWDEPQSATDLNNIAVITLIEAEQAQDLSIRSLYLETAIEVLRQGVQEESHPLCAAHIALINVMIGEIEQARRIAFSSFLEIMQPLYQGENLGRGLVYLPKKNPIFANLYTKEIDNLLQAHDGYAQALLLLTEVLVQAQLVFYNLSGLRFLQLGTQIAPNSVIRNLQLGLSCLANKQWEGLLYLQRSRELKPNYAQTIQSLYLAYKQLQKPAISQFWHQMAAEYYQQTNQSSDWAWSQLPLDSPFTYIPFDEEVLLAVESSLHSIVTLVLLAQRDWFETEIEFWHNQLQPGMTIIDVGANVGVYTFSAALKVGSTGKVIAVEPFVGCVKCLEETARINQLTQVKIYAAAASERQGTAFLALHAANELNEVVMKESVAPEGKNLLEIQCLTLDSLIEQENLSQVDWLKLDAEGHEMQVLAGCERLLREFSPNIIYENIAGSQSSNTPVAEYLLSRGYQLFRYRSYVQDLIAIESLEELQGNLNIIALPSA
ncbi:FkbM family methyltransferase [Gloeothece verrucosa]|uniref:Methyltransferase FkbM family n=1 Tax=Gloeothece verrucosa (strain PCC 7822) TaxID=497965 RepID=E0UF67_GLOV7|nr:FkbM family methyltransferase [Gloeothece verrucosa]ADN15438.1 methyltransferase FkbM family [Gloeothece verrucosa PCC 7822]